MHSLHGCLIPTVVMLHKQTWKEESGDIARCNCHFTLRFSKYDDV